MDHESPDANAADEPRPARPPAPQPSAWTAADPTILDMTPPATEPAPRAAEPAPSSPGLQLGRILLEKGIVTEAAIRECLAIQAEHAQQKGAPVPRLGELLVERGHATADQVREALAAQKRKILFCPRCTIQMNVEVRADAREYRCGACQTLLVEPPSGSTLRVADSRIVPVLREEMPPEVRAAARNPGARFGKYIIVGEIGQGGLGAVLKAWDTYFGQYVALKRPKPPSDPRSAASIESHIESLIQEARSLMLLRHPHIVAVYDIGRIGNEIYMSMEYIEGRTLAADIREAQSRGQISPYYENPAKYIAAMRDIARALHYAHTMPAPIVHCDLKPSNVLIDPSDRVVVVDFGLAHKLRSLRREEAGQVAGTPSYMAPEQAAGELADIDGRTDVYGVGAILYELLTGRPPFLGSVHSVLQKAVYEPAARPSDVVTPHGGSATVPSTRRLSNTLEEVCLKCLEKERAVRFQTAEELAEALDHILKSHARSGAESTVLAPPPAALASAREGRRPLGCRAAYAFFRRSGADSARAADLAAAAYERTGSARPLRDAVLRAAGALSPDADVRHTSAGDVAALEAHLAFFHVDPATAFGEVWAAETLRLALGALHQECERAGRREVYAELYARCRYDRPSGAAGRLERRARRRFREILRDAVAGMVKSPAVTDAELNTLKQLLASGPTPCGRCATPLDPVAVARLYAGFCPHCLLQVALDAAPPVEELGPYVIIGRLGTDALGEVYRAHSVDDAQEVRLRVLSNRTGLELARAAMKVRHRAALTILDAGEAEGKAYVVTEFVEGAPLREAVGSLRPSPRNARETVRKIAEVVQLIHESGLVHGQLDASKVILDAKGEPRVADFGFVRSTPEARAADVAALGDILSLCAGTPDLTPRSFATAADFLASLERPSGLHAAAAPAKPPPAATPKKPLPAVPPVAKRRSRAAAVLVTAALLLGGGALAAVLLLPRRGDARRPPPAETTADGTRDRAVRELTPVLAKAASRTDLEGCARTIAAHVQAWPDDPHGRWLAAYVELARGHPAEAERGARQIVRADDTASHAWRLIGLAAMERLDFAAAREALARSLGRAPRWALERPPWDEADDLLAQGLLAYATGEIEKAQALIKSSNDKRPSPEGYRWLGVVSADPNLNVRFQTAALELRPDYAPALVERGVARVALQRLDDGIADLERALSLGYDSARALLHRGIARAVKGQLEGAEADLSRAIELVPADVRGWLERARVRNRRRDFDGALSDASEAIRMDSTLADGHLERGRAHWKLRQPDEAELDFRNAVSLDPRLKAQVQKIRKE